MSLGGKAGYVARPPYDLRRQDRPHPEHTGQARAALFESLLDATFEIFELPVSRRRTSRSRSAANLRRVRAGPLRGRTPRSTRAAFSAERFFGAPPARRSLSNACRRLRGRKVKDTLRL